MFDSCAFRPNCLSPLPVSIESVNIAPKDSGLVRTHDNDGSLHLEVFLLEILVTITEYGRKRA